MTTQVKNNDIKEHINEDENEKSFHIKYENKNKVFFPAVPIKVKIKGKMST